MTKSQRLLEVMISINARDKFTIEELSQEFGVSYRTMHRYLQELSALGMPLYAEPGRHGGYFMLNKSTLLPDEVAERLSQTKNKVVRPKLLLVGVSITVPHFMIHTTESMVPISWRKLLNRVSEIEHVLDATRGVGVQWFSRHSYRYMAAFEVYELGRVPDGMESLILPTQSYAVYRHQGSYHRRWIHETCRYAEDDLERQGYVIHREAPILEMYSDLTAPDSPDRIISIHVPIVESARKN